MRIDIYPENHEYRQKQMVLNLIESTNLIGDINDDDRVNVEDLILTINMILDLISNQNEADINGDGGINILDISLILNIILDY